MVRTAKIVATWIVVSVGLVGCTVKPPNGDQPTPQAAPAPSKAMGGLRFWHTQTRDFEKVLQGIVADYNKQAGALPVEATYIGNYDQLYDKIRAGLHADDSSARPDLAVAYESMVSDYQAAGALRPLDDLVAKPGTGLDAGALGDIFPSFLAMNRFPQFDNKLLSFPFTKSILMLYSNQRLLDEIGAAVPQTWDELLTACRKLKAKHPDLKPFSFFNDASALDAIVLSFGGKLLEEDGSAGFGSPATTEAFRFWATMVKEKLVYEPTDKDKQNADFATGKTAFFMRTSAARPDLEKLTAGKLEWNAGALPHAANVPPVTVLFGANICLFASTPEREEAGWQFIKYFASSEVTAAWAAETGYLPVRKSALDTGVMRDYLAASPENKSAMDLMAQAVPEPNVRGWQDVRKALEKAHLNLMNGLAEPEAIAKELDASADAALAKAKSQP